ncbi:hypothetical protein J5751_04355 [bacterium]|nr:hypothetical protein [bacterium]
MNDVELTEEELDLIPYRSEIQDILEKENMVEFRDGIGLVQTSTAEEVFSAGCQYILELLKQKGKL